MTYTTHIENLIKIVKKIKSFFFHLPYELRNDINLTCAKFYKKPFLVDLQTYKYSDRYIFNTARKKTHIIIQTEL